MSYHSLAPPSSVPVLYLIAVLNTSSPYIPQHDGQAAALISQTKQWLTGTPDGTAWSAASSTNYDKAHVVDNLNSTILEVRTWAAWCVITCLPVRASPVIYLSYLTPFPCKVGLSALNPPSFPSLPSSPFPGHVSYTHHARRLPLPLQRPTTLAAPGRGGGGGDRGMDGGGGEVEL